MDRFLGRFRELLYALMRIVVGLLFACHGAQKIFGVLGGHTVFGNPRLLTAGLIELVAGPIVALGLFTAWTAFVASGEMAWAYFSVHAPQGWWPIENHGELAMLYCFVFLYIAARGAGSWSLDALRGKKSG